MDHSKDWIAPLHEPLSMPPILESPAEPSSVLDAHVVTTADDVCVFPVACPAADPATLTVQVQDGIGLADRMG